jgi:hypothetical protein
MQGGFKRYNEIQKALSSYAKQQGLSFKGSGKKFHEVASEIHQQTKYSPLKYALQNIDNLTDNIFTPPDYFPGITETQQDWFPFFNFAGHKNVWDPDLAPGNVEIQSFVRPDKNIPAPVFTYENIFKPFSDFCNKNYGVIWFDSDDAPKVAFTKPEPHPTKKGIFISELICDDPNNYGFMPDMEISELEFIQPEEKLPEPKIPEKISDKELRRQEAEEKAAQRTIRIKELEVESKKLDVEQRTKTLEILEKYEKYLDKGIITKAEFKKKVMELKL